MRKQDPLIMDIVNLHQSGDFEEILRKIKAICESGDKENNSLLQLLSWPSPTEHDLECFSKFIAANKVTHLYSIGCGTGLLEWLMLKVIQIECGDSFEGVTGVEIDFGWWSSAYSPPMFVPLRFVDKDFDCEAPFGKQSDMALFCYFNNLVVFLKYLETFQGKYVGILGPISKTQFCAPAPLELVENPDMPGENWKLVSFNPFGIGNVDHLAIYEKN